MVVAAPVAKKRCASNPTVPVVVVPFSSPATPPVPQGPSPGTTLLIKEWLLWTCKKKKTGEEFKTFGLWHGVPIFTFWCDQDDKGAMPEPDMSSNYIGLYKTHEDTFQILLTPRLKRPTSKKK